ncbi:TPA: hypothetical protein ACGZ9Q_002023 [Elizabethkingia anophelis]
MKKHLFYPALWGILTLSFLSSCRTEDGAITQKQVEDKRFAVFVPKDGKAINYANGFAFLMKRYDAIQKTNLSGINNKPIIGTLASTDKTASISQDGQSYIEFNVRSQIFNGENGDKWIIFPKVQGNNVIGLIYAILTEKETKVSYVDFNKQEPFYKESEVLFQEGLDRLRKRTKLNIIASIKPVAVDTDKEWPTEIQVEDVSVPGKPLPNPGGGSPGGGCIAHSNCINPGIDSGGGDGSGGGGGGGGGGDIDIETDVSPNFRMKLSDQQKYPRFTNMVKSLEQFVRNNPIVLKALIKNTGLTEAKVLEGLKWGKGPEIAIKDFTDNRYGQYTDGTNVLEISAKYVRGLEIVSLPASQKNTSFLLAITILHEYTHFGDYMADGKKEEWEMGWGFEQDILGKARATVEKDNAHIYIKMFNF